MTATATLIPPTTLGVEWSETSLVLTEDVTFERYSEIFQAASRLGDASRWWLGDLLVFGEMRFSDTYAQVQTDVGVSSDTLLRYRRVAAAIPPRRRRGNLSFSHHAEVASLLPDQQDALLSRAEAEDWSSGDLRERVQDSRRLDRAARPKQDVLGAVPVVGAVAGLNTIRDALGATYQHLRDPERVDALQAAETIGPALRALDEATEAVTEAAKVTDLRDAARVMVAHAAPGPRAHQGFWEVPKRLLDDVAAIVGEDLDGE